MQQRALIIGSISPLLFTFLIIAFGILPTIKNLYEIEKRIYEERVTLEQQYLNRIKARQTLRYLGVMKEKLPELQNIGVREGQEIELITSLENIADQYGLAQQLTIQPPDVDNGQKNKNFVIVLRLKGDAVALLRYLRGVEKLNQYFFIDNISINKAQPQSGEIFVPETISAVIQSQVPGIK